MTREHENLNSLLFAAMRALTTGGCRLGLMLAAVLAVGSNSVGQDPRSWTQHPHSPQIVATPSPIISPPSSIRREPLPTQLPGTPGRIAPFERTHSSGGYPLDQQLQQLHLPSPSQPHLTQFANPQPEQTVTPTGQANLGQSLRPGLRAAGPQSFAPPTRRARLASQSTIGTPTIESPSSPAPRQSDQSSLPNLRLPTATRAREDVPVSSNRSVHLRTGRTAGSLAAPAGRVSTNAINVPNFSVLPSEQLGTFFDWRYATPPETPAIGDQSATLASATLNEANVADSHRAYKLAEQPKEGEHFHDETPALDQRTFLVPYSGSDFQPDPIYSPLVYDDQAQRDVYEGKKLNATQRPLIEWGRKFYPLGDLPRSATFLGETNLVAPRFLVYGDYRTAFASNTQNGNSQGVWAQRLNLDIDLKITSTERIHAFTTPLNQGGQFTRGIYDDGEFDFIGELDPNFDTGFFEGDLGAIMGGFGNEVIPFDMPFAIGVMPLLFQNGVWMDDAILGAAATIPARNSPMFDISNMDITFFAGFDRIDSPAFQGDDDAARLYGIASFIEALNGYFEIDYAYLEDRALIDRSYHNFGAAYTRRYGRLVSTSYRVIANVGQNAANGLETADGALLLWENSLITSSPYTCLPYLNLFAGFGRPQSVARVGDAGGVLRNTGINFESDALTGYPTLDATANDTFGGAMGMSLLSSNFDQQLIVELAMLNTMGNDPARNANGNQYAMGIRYQIPISNSVILRADAMHGFLESEDDIFGARVELRHKF